MKRLLVSFVALSTVVGLGVACSPASALAPTQAPAKAAETTKAAVPSPTAVAAPPTKAALPTAAPISKVDYPAKGKTITFLIGYDAGSATDVGGRILAPQLEKNLGVPVAVVNKPGAGGQVGYTELANSKPDGYTFGFTAIPSGITMYLDPDRKATFTRKSFVPLTAQVIEPDMIAVKKDSSYKTTKDLLDAAKANPEKVTLGFTGVLSHQHMAALQLMKQTGAKFAIVSFDSGAPARTALLGGHIDAQIADPGTFLAPYKNGEIRVLGIFDKQQSRFYPDVSTLESQGYPAYMGTARVLSFPAGVVPGIVDVMSSAMKKSMEDPEYQKKMEEQGLTSRWMSPADTEKYWADLEESVKPLMELAKQK